MPTGYDEQGNPVYAEWTDEMKDSLVNVMKVVDGAQEGLGRHQLRTFLPNLGWNDVQKGLDALIAEGRLVSGTKKIGVSQVEVFTWQEV